MRTYRWTLAPAIVLAVTTLSLFGDEGMWTFDNIPRGLIRQQYGFEITDQWLERVRLSAIRVSGASASFVSPDGLVLTNQHVGRDQVAKLSTPQRNLLRDGLYDRAAAFDGKAPFALPARWRHGRAKLDLQTPFNFAHTADTIGGNSGTPIINRNAEVVGVNFDSNLQKLPHRYVYVDEAEGLRAGGVHSAGIIEGLTKLYGATPLVQELTGRR